MMFGKCKWLLQVQEEARKKQLQQLLDQIDAIEEENFEIRQQLQDANVRTMIQFAKYFCWRYLRTAGFFCENDFVQFLLPYNTNQAMPVQANESRLWSDIQLLREQKQQLHLKNEALQHQITQLHVGDCMFVVSLCFQVSKHKRASISIIEYAVSFCRLSFGIQR